MHKSLFLTAIFVLSVLSPMALADVTETQFEDGSTSYTHTFSGTGDAFAGNLTFPYGAEVSSASFDISGSVFEQCWDSSVLSETLERIGKLLVIFGFEACFSCLRNTVSAFFGKENLNETSVQKYA